MSVRRILELGNPLLWRRCEPVKDPTSATVAAVAEDLKDTLEDFQITHGWGRGIAAPQLGVPLRLIVVGGASMDFSGALVNPRIVSQSEERFALWDGCFSFPGVVVGVSRAAKITVEYTDLHGAGRSMSADWIPSQLLQHEIDHLDGILAVQEAISSQHFLTREEWQRRGKPEYVDMTGGG
jgi:peptide deformylase